MRWLFLFLPILCHGQSGLKATYSCVSTTTDTTGLTSTCMSTRIVTQKAPIDFKWTSGRAPIKSIKPIFNLVLEGYISVPKTDTYTFYVTSDDGSNLSIAEATITNDYSDHAARTTQGKILLSALANCKLVLRYYNACCAGSLKLEYSTSTVARKLVPVEWLNLE